MVLGFLGAILIAAITFAAYKINIDLTSRGISSGFGYLLGPSAIPIDNPPIPYRPYENTYLRAFSVGVVNTLLVSLAGILCATLLGGLLGIVRLSSHPLLKAVSKGYVELFRNVPVVLQLMFWYMAILHMPTVRQAVSLYDLAFISNRGLNLPWLHISGGPISVSALGLALAIPLVWIGVRRSRSLPAWVGRAAAMTTALLAAVAALTGLEVDLPRKSGFSIVGGVSITTEFATLLIGLTVYFSTYIGEILRSSIAGISGGQWEGASSLGLSRWLTLRLVIIPQALRRMLPPLSNQYANLIKTSSLAVVIGFQDIVSITNTIINQTGQAIESIILIATTYLIINLAISALLNMAEGWLPGLTSAQER